VNSSKPDGRTHSQISEQLASDAWLNDASVSKHSSMQIDPKNQAKLNEQQQFFKLNTDQDNDKVVKARAQE